MKRFTIVLCLVCIVCAMLSPDVNQQNFIFIAVFMSICIIFFIIAIVDDKQIRWFVVSIATDDIILESSKAYCEAICPVGHYVVGFHKSQVGWESNQLYETKYI